MPCARAPLAVHSRASRTADRMPNRPATLDPTGITEGKAPMLEPQTLALKPWWSRFATSGALYAWRRRRQDKEQKRLAE